MEAALDPYEVLHSTAGKANFQRITRLLISGGTSLLREIFDAIHPPSNLATILSNSDTKKQLKTAKLTKPQWDCLYPSPGVYGKSVDFDVTLLFRLLRTICGLAPPTTGWDALPASTDHSLNADLARVKHYRNSIYGHVNQGMEIKDEEFPSFWQDISETLVRIAGQISLPKKTAWQGAIDNLLNDPLTVEDEQNVQELAMWYKSDMEVKKSIEEVCERMNRLEEELKEKTNVVIEKVQKEGEGIKENLKARTQDGMDMIETVVREEAQDITEKLKNTTREEAQDIKDQLGQMHQSIDRLSSSAATSQSAGARLRVRIDCEAITESGSMQEGATGIIQAPQEPRAVLLDAAVVPLTSNQPQIVVTTGAQKKTTGALASQDSQVVQGAAVVPVTSRQTQAVVTTGSGGVNVGNEGLPSAQGVLNFIALKCFKEVDPSKPEELNGYLQYLKEVRKVLFVDAQSGSLIITVECGSVQILDELWEDYRTGHLNEMAQKFLVTEEILKELGLIAVKLTTTILREEYRACREYLFDIQPTVPGERDPLLPEKGSKVGKPLRSPLRGDKRNAPDGTDSVYQDSIERKQTEPVTGSQPDAVPPVEIKPAPKGKTVKAKPPKESTAKSSGKSKEAESKSKQADSKSKGAEGTNEKKSKLLDLKKFDIIELDSIFTDFKTTFDPFVQNREDMQKSEDSFKKAVQSLGEIHPHASISEYVAALKTKLKDEKITVKIKEGALTIYEQGGAMVKGISNAVTAVNAMLKLGKDLKAMPLTIQKGSEDAVDRAEDMDVQGILKREFKSVWDLGKIPKLKKAFNNNVEQIRGAPKMVRDFYSKTKEIIMEIYHAFADEEDIKKMEEEIAEDDEESEKEEEEKGDGGDDKKKKNAKKESGATGGNGSKKDKKKDDFHKKLKFESVGLADIDNVFISLSSTINPFVETRERIQAAREAFENVVKTVCKFDAKKELKDYIKELKDDAKEGNITIYIDEVDGEIKVKSIEGVKPPKPYRDAVQALKNIKSSGKEAVELEPHVQHGIEECVTRIKQIDPQRDFHSLLKKKTDVFTLPGKIKKFNDNRKKAQEIPGIVKEFCLYVEQLLKDILEGLTGEKEETEENKGEESGAKDEDSDKKDDSSDKKNEGADEKDPDGKKDEEQSSAAKGESVKKEDDSSEREDSGSEDGDFEEPEDWTGANNV